VANVGLVSEMEQLQEKREAMMALVMAKTAPFLSSERSAAAYREINAMPDKWANSLNEVFAVHNGVRMPLMQADFQSWACVCGTFVRLGVPFCPGCHMSIQWQSVADPRLAPAPVPAPAPQAAALAVEEPSDEDRFAMEYAQLATKLGVAARPKMRDLRLRNLLAEEGISVYPLEAVERYMRSITPPNKAWVWMPVRACDVTPDGGNQHYLVWGVSRENWRTFNIIGKEFLGAQYSKPLPLPVLQTMGNLVERMPEGLVFLVTDIIDVPKPDPFLAVRLKDSTELFVIERWDEPAFRSTTL